MRKVVTLLFIVLLSAVVALGECDSPNCGGLDVWLAAPPFEDLQTEFCPYTLGLPINAAAPSIEGVDFQTANTVLVVINRNCDPEYYPLIGKWGEIPGCQVVVIVSGMTSSRQSDLRQALGEGVKIIADPVAAIACAFYQVGAHGSPVTFLVNQRGTIVYRRRAFPNYAVPELEKIVRYFAAHGVVPDNTLFQQVLWYGNKVRWPSFPLYTLDGKEVWLKAGVPRLIYFGSNQGNSACAFSELSTLQGEFPQVEFIWLNHYFSETAETSIWEYGRRIGLDKDHPEFFAVPLSDFLARANKRWAKLRDELKETASAPSVGWQVLLDEDNRLITSWNLFGMPTVIILDADGKVAFPCSLYPINLMTKEAICHPKAKEELKRILAEISGE